MANPRAIAITDSQGNPVTEHVCGQSVALRAEKRGRRVRYIAQYVQWFHEQPIVAWSRCELASLGGRNTGST